VEKRRIECNNLLMIDEKPEVTAQMRKLISQGESFSFIGMRDNCKINQLRYLGQMQEIQDNYKWVLVDLGELMEVSLRGFYQLILVSMGEKAAEPETDPMELFGKVKKATKSKIVLAFNNFDIVRKLDLDRLYHQLMALDAVCIFTGTRPFEENHFCFKKIVWTTPFSGRDALEVVTRNEKRYGVKVSGEEKAEIVRLSGGHGGMIKFLIQSLANGKSPGENEDTDFQCERILSSLTDLEKAKLKANLREELLINLGMQVESGSRVRIFSPLLESFLKKEKTGVPVFCRDEENDEVYYLGRPMKRELACKEFEVLKLLVSKPGKVFNREEIMNKVWGEEGFPSDWALDKQISRLREKIGEENLKVIRGQGVMIVSG
jgi:hypothetical protein